MAFPTAVNDQITDAVSEKGKPTKKGESTRKNQPAIGSPKSKASTSKGKKRR